MVKKVLIVLAGLAAVLWLFFAAVGAASYVAERVSWNGDIQIRTDPEPIYNHFPGLPETSVIRWGSRTSGGIGPSTVKVYFFAFYDHDISNEMRDMEIADGSEDIELGFVPDGLSGSEGWRRVENAGTAFQTGIKDFDKMATVVYLNDTGNILYVEAIGGG
mgnify:CR=1 FL=1